ncbi:MAG: AMP-binding protein [Acidobacteriota bacterium]|nr:AMP-binding protein [Acidobacteriota bacterium]
MAPISFGRRTAQLAELHPDEAALVFARTDGTERVVTWAELDGWANQMARLLEERGVGPRSMVAVALPNSPEHVAVDIAGWRLGACVLPLRPDLPDWERRRLLDVASPAVLVGDWPAEGHTVVSSAELDGARSLPAGPVEDRVPDPAFAIATSGSTGRPKLIVSPGPGVYDAEAPTALHQGMGAARRPVQLVPAPMYHTNGYRILHLALDRDELVVLMERFDAALAAELIERHRVTSVTMAPVMLLRLARLEGIEERDLTSVTSILQGAASCPPWLVRWWIEHVGPEHFFISYGASERVGLAFLRGDEWLAHPGSVGRGLNTDIRILDDEGGDLPTGEVGEIFLRQTSDEPSGYRYVGAPPAKQTPDGFTSLGDMGWLDTDGYLYIADRRVDMIVTGGANVFPAEVEAALLEHPEVADCAVVGLPDEEWGSRVHAVVQPRHPGKPPAEDDLRRHCRERLAGYKVPKSVSFMSPLPRTEAGKLNHGALAAQLAGGTG